MMANDPYASDEWAALVRNMRTDDSDLARLVAADWLQEHGEDERAEVVRSHVEEHADKVQVYGEGVGASVLVCEPTGRLDLLGGKIGFRRVQICRPIRGVSLTANRGFVTGVRCDLREWLGWGPWLCRRHPVKYLDIGDRHYAGRERACGWVEHRESYGGNVHCHRIRLPTGVFRFLTGHVVSHPASSFLSRECHYRETAAAMADMNAACLKWARAEVDGSRGERE